MRAMVRERAASSQWLCRDVQAAVKGFKKVICFESSPVNHEATKAAAKEQEVRSRMWHTRRAKCSASNDDAAVPIVAAYPLYCHAIAETSVRRPVAVHRRPDACRDSSRVCIIASVLCLPSSGCAHPLQIPEDSLQLVNMAVLNVTGFEVEVLLGAGAEGAVNLIPTALKLTTVLATAFQVVPRLYWQHGRAGLHTASWLQDLRLQSQWSHADVQAHTPRWFPRPPWTTTCCPG